MNPQQAAEQLWHAWRQGDKLTALPPSLRPASLADGYAIQACLPAVSGQTVFGWKIAATNPTGQAHIGVDGPIGGRLLASQIIAAGGSASMQSNKMAVAEAEFAFRLAHALPPRDEPYSEAEVLAAIGSLHPAIELPDSRFADFATAGAAQLAADNACAHLFVFGDAVTADWRTLDLAAQPVKLIINDATVTTGQGADVLGSPLSAMTWLANQAALLGEGLQAGQVVTTGVCGSPCPIKADDHIVADFGALGRVSCRLTA